MKPTNIGITLAVLISFDTIPAEINWFIMCAREAAMETILHLISSVLTRSNLQASYGLKPFAISFCSVTITGLRKIVSKSCS